jgi:preprotein translocase subunit YajC
VLLAAALLLAAAERPVYAQRERTRPAPRRSTSVSESQAGELTLTVTEVAVRPIQVWVRTAGAIDDGRRIVTADVESADRTRVKVGQRVRAFSPESRSRMYQATISDILPRADRVVLKATLMGQALETGRHFVLEIVTDNGDFLSVPNEAIIEAGGKQLVYVQEAGGSYAPRDVSIGLRGELYSQVVEGLKAGEQVVTIGSFFIDAEHKLKGS